MSTRLDGEFVVTARKSFADARGSFETLVSEVVRLEAYCAALEKRLTAGEIREADREAAMNCHRKDLVI